MGRVWGISKYNCVMNVPVLEFWGKVQQAVELPFEVLDPKVCGICRSGAVLRLGIFFQQLHRIKRDHSGVVRKRKIAHLKEGLQRREKNAYQVYLTCGHGFCSTCITAEVLGGSGEGIRCPVCSEMSGMTVPSRMLLTTFTARMLARQIIEDIKDGRTDMPPCPLRNNCASHLYCPYRHNMRWELLRQHGYTSEQALSTTDQGIAMEERRKRLMTTINKSFLTTKLLDVGFVQLHLVEWMGGVNKPEQEGFCSLKPDIIQRVPCTMDGVNRLQDHVVDPPQYTPEMHHIVTYLLEFMRSPSSLAFRLMERDGMSPYCLLHDLMAIGVEFQVLNYARPTVEQLNNMLLSLRPLFVYNLTKRIIMWLYATGCL